MSAGNTIKTIFGALPDQDTLRRQTYPAPYANTNAHVHLPPNFGSISSVDEAIEKAKREQIAVLGASNYYDYTIYTPFAHAAVKAGITPVFGIEVLTMDDDLRQKNILVNDPKNPGKFYICGKGLTTFDAIDEAALPIWKRIREGDTQRIEEMIANINAIPLLKERGVCLSYQEIARNIATLKQVPVETVFLQERHLAHAVQQALFASVAEAERRAFLQKLYQTDGAVETQDVVKAQNDIRTYLFKQGKAAYADERYISPQEAAQLILGLGGYVSYPILIDGVPTLSPFEATPDALAEHLLARQIGAAEFIPTRNDPNTLTMFVKRLREYALPIGAGTEHNDAVWIPLLPTCRKSVPLSEELQKTFWEGACVAAAHQYLCAKDQPGFRFFADKAEREAQIRDFAALGASVVAAIASRA